MQSVPPTQKKGVFGLVVWADCEGGSRPVKGFGDLAAVRHSIPDLATP